jgi:hypothetical protein
VGDGDVVEALAAARRFAAVYREPEAIAVMEGAGENR